MMKKNIKTERVILQRFSIKTNHKHYFKLLTTFNNSFIENFDKNIITVFPVKKSLTINEHLIIRRRNKKLSKWY